MSEEWGQPSQCHPCRRSPPGHSVNQLRATAGISTPASARLSQHLSRVSTRASDQQGLELGHN